MKAKKMKYMYILGTIYELVPVSRQQKKALQRFEKLGVVNMTTKKKHPLPTGKGYKRDRMFLSKEDHEQAYKGKRKKPCKVYKKKA